MKPIKFESRLRGRLALLEGTKCVTRETQESHIVYKYGRQLAKLVGSGNQYAIDLVSLSEARERYLAATTPVNLYMLREYDEAIAAYRSRLGIYEATELELSDMLRLASGAGFNSAKQLGANLSEGLILNVNTLASRVLSIPAGEYVVWTTDAASTMLVPTSEAKQAPNDIQASNTNTNGGIEVSTPGLMGCWNKLERIIGERDERHWHKTDKSGEEGGGREPHVSKASSGRPNLRNARLSTGKSLSDVSSATGWAIPTIAKAELYSQNDSSNPHAPSYEVIDDLVNYYGADYKDAFRTGPVEPYANTAQNTDPHDVGKTKRDKKPKDEQ